MVSGRDRPNLLPMTSSPSSERILLTYPTPRYTKLLVYVSLAILAYAYLRLAPYEWFWPKDQHPDAQGVVPFAWRPLIPIIALAFSLFLAIGEGLFLIGRKRDHLKLEFDDDNFYINNGNGEQVIPLKNIVSLRMVYSKSVFDGAKSLYRYTISFGDPYTPEEITLTIYTKTQRTFSNFRKLVKQKNPSLQEKNWASNFDGLVGWFKGRKS